MSTVTWYCHVCLKEREDRFISVFTKDISEELGLSPGTVKQNVRYCKDNPTCAIEAETKNFFRVYEDGD